ncbi:unnamed protein product [Candidula unifasciata]|uniref:Uncharacterized protein n=1 Tax=Candidula unifasciata TaxID=100452 RepID=A0A8S3YYZ8_9EUPU|nr:unnamed protein product [Candidula unifasciata]
MTDNWKQARKSKAQNLNLTSAYSFQIKRPDSLVTIVSDDASRGISFDEISEDLLRVIYLMENEKSPATIKSIKTILKKIPATYAHFIPTWTDKNDMDLLHHVIINNCPEIVHFLLAECNWFPVTYMPEANPYAHLAAIFGHKECLRQLLNYRPNDYFTASKHILKLPSTIRKKTKFNETTNKGVKKQINKLLGKIQSSENIVEMTLLQDQTELGNITDVSNTLADEFKALEGDRKLHSRGIRRLKNAQYSRKLSTAGSRSRKHEKVTFATSVSDKRHTAKDFSDIAKFQISDRGKDDKDAKYQKLPLGTANKKHIISVYCDEFSEAPQGVVKGAGQQVLIKYYGGMTKLKHESAQPPGTLDIKRNTSIMPSISTQRNTSKLVTEEKTSATVEQRNARVDSAFPKIVEAGVRGKGKYKDFQLKIESRKIYPKDQSKSLRNKTPLSLAAEYGHLECVQMILETHILRNHPTIAVKEPLTLATKAKSPDAILFLMNQRISIPDYQSAVLTAIRDMYPDCLTALLAQKSKERHSLFDGVNLYHILYTQTLMSDYRFEMLPVMTNVLISSGEDVNAHNVYCTFPIYTLINCAFNISIGKQIFFYINCLKMLLENKANCHYDEVKDQKLSSQGQSFSRSSYSSAINCILENAVNSTNYFENTRSSKIFMKKLISTVTACDRTNRRILNDILFNYMDTVCLLGIDRYIVKCLLRYGSNPDFCLAKKYAINAYFDNILPYLSRFEVNPNSADDQDINALLLLCRGMSYRCLKEAQLIFLNENLMQCPIQALPLFRYFSYGLNELLRSPRPLLEILGHFMWLRFRRNEKKVKALPLPDEIIAFILP